MKRLVGIEILALLAALCQIGFSEETDLPEILGRLDKATTIEEQSEALKALAERDSVPARLLPKILSLPTDLNSSVTDLDPRTQKARDTVARLSQNVLQEKIARSVDGDPLPFLIQALSHPRGRILAINLLKDLKADAAPATTALSKLVTDGNQKESNKAMETLRAIGPPARESSASLAAVLRDPNVWQNHAVAIKALEAIGATDNETVTVVIGSLGGDQEARQAAEDFLDSHKIRTEDHLEAFVASLVTEHQGNPYIFARLAKLGTKAVPNLITAFRTADNQARHNITQALSEIGQPAIPALKEAVTDATGLTLAGCLQALRSIMVFRRDGLMQSEIVLKALKDAHPDVRCEALKAVDATGASQEACNAIYVQATHDPEEIVRAIATTAIGWGGHRSKEHLPIVEKMTKDSTHSVRRSAFYTLAAIDSTKTTSLVDYLVSQLHAIDPERQPSIIMDLVNLGPKAKPAEEAMNRLIADPKSSEVSKYLAKAAVAAIHGKDPGIR